MVEESIQNLTSFKLLLRLSGVSTLQYQLSTLLANFTLFTLIYFLLLLVLSTVHSSLNYLELHETSFVIFTLLGTFANVSFSQFLGLLLSHFLEDPNVVLIIFVLFVSYCLVFTFNYSIYPGYIFPTLMSSYALTKSGFRGES